MSDPVADGIERMLSTDDSDLRNHLAMDLAETGDPRVKAALISLILRPELRNLRGTLVYALQTYDCSDQAPFLLELVRTGNFEVAAHATNIIEKTGPFPPEQAPMLAAGLVETARTASEEWRVGFAHQLLQTLPG